MGKNSKSIMKKVKLIAILFFLILFMIVLFCVVIKVINKFTPSKEIMPLDQYYLLEKDNDVAIVLQDTIYEKKAIIVDGQVYINFDTISEIFNNKFYWDRNEELLIYTTPTEVIKTQPSVNEYYINKEKQVTDYTIVLVEGDEVYVAIDYVNKYSDFKYNLYENPYRIVVTYKWGDVLYSDVKKDTAIRYMDNIKSDILTNVKEGTALMTIDATETVQNGFRRVVTDDGIIGYIQSKYLNNSYYEVLESDYIKPEYTCISKDEKIILGWHQVTRQEANSSLSNIVQNTKGINVISPTWFSIINESPEISSLASETYVETAHNLGLEVWGLVDDFNSGIDIGKILGYTSRREKLITELISTAIKYNLDGINIDFENISANIGEDFIQFIRELSIRCRKNEIVLSVDTTVPKEYSKHYNRDEIGEIADYLIIMGYDEHYANSPESGSVSSYNFFKDGIYDTLNLVPKEKFIMALPFYTRLWKETTNSDGTLNIQSVIYSMGNAENLLSEKKVEPVWNDETKQYYAQYTEEDSLCKIWLENEASIEEKLKLIKKEDLAGVGAWKLGLEKQSIWKVITQYIN